RRRTDGLGDRRLTSVATTTGGNVHLWAVGRGGAWRRIPERLWLSRRRERVADQAVEEGAPPVWALLEAAENAHLVDESRLATMLQAGKWSFLLPQVRLEYQYRVRREEDLVDIPALGQDIFTQVRVYPNGHYARVTAMWDLYPVIWGFFEGRNPHTGPTVAEETVRALATRHQIRSAVVGLYNLWGQQRMSWRRSTPPSSKAAIKAVLGLQHIEADLHVLTDGAFTPMTTLETILKGGTP
ncbi:MAG: hypothetical protein QF464_17640, partial [Myxococcota bacterium]|nr:hypothetical protein [Myxococcota bacterium]